MTDATLQIGLDFDATYTRAPEFFQHMMSMALVFGNISFIIVTSRRDTPENRAHIAEQLGYPWPIICCNHNSKYEVVKARGVRIDIWMDDDPWSVVGLDKPVGA
jgi:hypothetical protein